MCFLLKKKKKKGTHRDPRNHISAAIHTCIHVSIPYIHHTQVGLRHAPYDNCVLRQSVRPSVAFQFLSLIGDVVLYAWFVVYLFRLFIFIWVEGVTQYSASTSRGSETSLFLGIDSCQFSIRPCPRPSSPYFSIISHCIRLCPACQSSKVR